MFKKFMGMFICLIFLLSMSCVVADENISKYSSLPDDIEVMGEYNEINDEYDISNVDSISNHVSVRGNEKVIDSGESDLLSSQLSDEQISYASNDMDNLGVSNSETNIYLEDIRASTSEEYYRFVDYLINQKSFKFNTKSTDDGYTIFSDLDYESKLYDGDNYILISGNTYFVSKNRMDYVIDEYYPSVLYSQNNDVYLDELYLGWLKNVENYRPVLNIGGTNTPIYITSVESSFQSSSSLPVSFDLRNVNGNNYVTPIRDQANSGICWAFASIAALESFLLKNEGKSYEFSTKYDFSENNLKNVMSNIGKQGIYTRSPNDGGNDNIALAYLIRWSGPILEEYDKYDLITRNPINNIPLEFFNSEKHVQGVKYIHARNSAMNNDEIKRAIMDYGAVATSLLWNSKFVNGYNYYCYDAALANPKEDGHEICIIGWDDNYKKTNFGRVTPPEDGAFIVKNSWGSNAGDNGYYYISYYDVTLANRVMAEFFNYCTGIVFTSVEDNTNYGKNYNYNPQGVTFWLDALAYGMPATTFSYYSQWVASDDDNLKACGVYVNDACECGIKVFVDDVLKGTTNNVPLSYAGFHTIQLSKMVPVKKGQKFRIEITLNSKTPILLPAELSWKDFNMNNPDNYNNAYANVDETGYINNGNLIDITKRFKSCNICMNVYTEYKKILDTKIDVSSISMDNGIIKEVTVKLSDLSNNVLQNFELISCKGSNYQVLTTNNDGEATFAAMINGDNVDMCIYYLGSAMYNYVFKELKINMAPLKIDPPVIAVPPQPQLSISAPTTNIPSTGVITKPTSKVTILKISGISGKYSYKQSITLKIKAKITLSVTVKGNKKTSTVKFSNGKGKLELKNYNLKKGISYSFSFKGKKGNYEVLDNVKVKPTK